MKNSIIVTGAAGFVGGATMLHFKDQGHNVIGIDIRATPNHLRGVPDIFLQEDYTSSYILEMIDREQPKAIIHCAGTSLVGPSLQNPEIYYNNNFIKTKTLLDYIVQHRVTTRIIFSSSSSIYGEPVMVPIHETDPAAPVSPYGESKLMTEMLLNSYARAYGLDFVAFRYFNVCGADPRTRHGQRARATHIIARILESMRDGKGFTLNGTDYDTPDGTCVRDHVHVMDVALAHELALSDQFPLGFYNVGLEHGASNQEIIDVARRVAGRELTVTAGPRRGGDPGQLVGSNKKLLAQGWQPRYDLSDMIAHAWAWYQKNTCI
jgi:UDP-glucose 4-epimerase